MAKKAAITTLRGLHVATHCPTEERLTIQIHGLTPNLFKALAHDLEDWFLVVDDAFKETFTRGRSWKGRGRRVSRSTRTRTLTVSPYPSRFSNILKSLRRSIYEFLAKNGLVLEKDQRGAFGENMYILPYSRVVEFMSEIKKLNKTIDGLNKRISEFKKTRYFRQLKQILTNNGISDLSNPLLNTENGSIKLEHIDIDVTPLALETSTVKELVKTEYRKMFQKVSETAKEADKRISKKEEEALAELQAAIDRKRKELVVKSIQNIEKKLRQITMKIAGQRKLNPKRVKAELKRLQEISESVGLESVAARVIAPLNEVVDNPKKAEEIFGTSDLNAGVRGRVEALIRSL